MDALKEIQQTIEAEIAELNEKILGSLSSSNKLMDEIIRGYLTKKGKMIRPILVILTGKLFGGGKINENVISAAAAVEMLHNASLIHDDVVDESQLRRSQPTINSSWGNHLAVLVGDFFVSNALQQGMSTGDIRVVGVLANLGKLLSLGEIDQIYNARFHKLDERAYFETISRKTASLFVSCIKMGAYCSGVDDDRLERMEQFAERLGLCFQIKDDIFDYFEDPIIGKPTGTDLREGKITLPLLYALTAPAEGDRARDEQQRMLALSRKEQLDSEEISALIDYAKRRGGIDYAYSTMDRLRDRAAAILATFPEDPTTRAFSRIFDFVIARDK